MAPAERIAALEQRIADNTAWRATWMRGAGRTDPTEFYRRGDELASDRQELERLKGAPA